MNILKGIGAVLAGLILIVITHNAVDKVLEGLGIFPPPDEGLHVTWMLALALTYRVLLSIAGVTSPLDSLHRDRWSTLSFSAPSVCSGAPPGSHWLCRRTSVPYGIQFLSQFSRYRARGSAENSPIARAKPHS